jgi:hypothetical protein
MMSNVGKANTLRKAMELLAQADALVQSALGASDNCYEVHCALEDLEDTLAGFAEQLEEMQVTE